MRKLALLERESRSVFIYSLKLYQNPRNRNWTTTLISDRIVLSLKGDDDLCLFLMKS